MCLQVFTHSRDRGRGVRDRGRVARRGLDTQLKLNTWCLCELLHGQTPSVRARFIFYSMYKC